MTDAETYAAICADFPFSTEVLRGLHKRLDGLLGKSQNRPPQGKADGSIDWSEWHRLRALTWAMGNLVHAMEVAENGGEPWRIELVKLKTGVDDDIPF